MFQFILQLPNDDQRAASVFSTHLDTSKIPDHTGKEGLRAHF